MPVRIRLALISAGLTFAILALFAGVIGLFAARQVRSENDDELRLTAADLQPRLVQNSLSGPIPVNDEAALRAATAAGGVVRIILPPYGVAQVPRNSPHLGPPREGVRTVAGYRVATRPIKGPGGVIAGYLDFGKPRERVNHTIGRIDLFLLVGVLGGTLLAFLAGLALARRAMSPIANLTQAARGIARTRDPGVSLPKPEADDEVADLANTLDDMLRALDASRAETEGALARQREFVADASHELRTPLTSILANLELLEAELQGEARDMAGSALRSSRRMRRLVADLLLLARADAGREGLRETVDLAEVVSEAAAEAMPVAAGHELAVRLPSGNGGGPYVIGVSDDLHRLALNLIENALAHTPPGTEVEVALVRDGDFAVLTVSDAGPGIPPELRGRIFDRFVRGSGESAGGGSGLGLAIVRAVAERHGGTVRVDESGTGGARFTVRLPAPPAAGPGGQTSTTTGSTIGRRLSRS